MCPHIRSCVGETFTCVYMFCSYRRIKSPFGLFRPNTTVADCNCTGSRPMDGCLAHCQAPVVAYARMARLYSRNEYEYWRKKTMYAFYCMWTMPSGFELCTRFVYSYICIQTHAHTHTFASMQIHALWGFGWGCKVHFIDIMGGGVGERRRWIDGARASARFDAKIPVWCRRRWVMVILVDYI